MREIRKTTQFKKDFKRYKNDKSLYEIVVKLANDEEIPSKYTPHELKGNMKGYMGCHVEGDFLLIWYDKIANVIELVRLGSHSELFGK